MLGGIGGNGVGWDGTPMQQTGLNGIECDGRMGGMGRDKMRCVVARRGAAHCEVDGDGDGMGWDQIQWERMALVVIWIRVAFVT